MEISMSALLRSVAVAAIAIAVAGTGYPASAAGPVDASGQTITINLDQARLLRLPEGTSTLVVGNPLIADVAVQSGGTLVITGKGYGNTNLLALNRDGAVIMEHQVLVEGPKGPLVVVYRGAERETYSCTPNCERRITLGDGQAYFEGTIGQSSTMNSQVQGGGSSSNGTQAK
jgi:Flp pilus assembly secretin CpaC